MLTQYILLLCFSPLFNLTIACLCVTLRQSCEQSDWPFDRQTCIIHLFLFFSVVVRWKYRWSLCSKLVIIEEKFIVIKLLSFFHLRAKTKQLTNVLHFWELLQDCWRTIPSGSTCTGCKPITKPLVMYKTVIKVKHHFTCFFTVQMYSV